MHAIIARKAMANWFRRMCDRGFSFPRDYVVFDCETTGLKIGEDYILQFGHLIVEDCKPREPVETILDWTTCKDAPHGHFRQRLYYMDDYFKERGRTAKFSYENIAKEGIDPIKVLNIYHEMFSQHQENGGYFLTHNGIRYDTEMVASHFRRFIGQDITFDRSRMIDTGLLEKARQLDWMLKDDESISTFYQRVSDVHAKDIHWSLDRHCVPQYKLVEKANLDMRKAHTAGFDCYATHLLMEEFRRISEES